MGETALKLYEGNRIRKMAFTFFFRDMHTLKLIASNVIPHIYGRSKIRIWDAGCAMGQEAYSLAIMFAENLGHFAFNNLNIMATDIDGSNLFEKIIVEGIYHEVEVKRIEKNLFEKYFIPAEKPDYHQVIERVRSRIYFKKHDLLSLESVGEGFSLILCKNVLLHFQFGERIDVIKMFHRALGPGGYLATEQTQKIPGGAAHLFRQVTGDGQIFQKIEVSK